MKRDVIEIEFPVLGEKLLGNDGDWRSNAYVHPSRSHDAGSGWLRYIDGFRRATELMAEEVQTRRDRDGLIFPLVFSYRHQCELSLKAIIIIGTELLHLPPAKFPKHHDIGRLWPDAKKILVQRYGIGDPGVIQAVGQQLMELVAIDQGSYAFRYPVKTDGITPSHAPSLQTINLDQFCRTATKLCEFLHCTANGMSCDLDCQREGEADAYMAGREAEADYEQACRELAAEHADTY